MQLRGWRELAFLLQLAPPTPDTLDLMTRALDVHERPLAHAFADILKRFTRLEVETFLESLLSARWARQIIALEILSILVQSSPLLWEYLAAVLCRYTNNPAAPEIVSSKALRILGQVIDSGPPRDILCLFHRPELRVLHSDGQRDAWRVGLSASTSFTTHGAAKVQSHLPALPPVPAPTGIPISASMPHRIVLGGMVHTPTRRPLVGHPP
jgi:hypothetical protein